MAETKILMGKNTHRRNYCQIIGLVIGWNIGLVWFFTILGCGVTYPEDDNFKILYPGEESYYFLTNTSYQIVNGTPEVNTNVVSDQLLLVLNQRNNIYYPEGFEVEFKKFDSRWFIQIDNLMTNYLIFSNTNFSSDVSMHYHSIDNNLISFTNGYFMITQSSPMDNWILSINVSNQDIGQNYTREHIPGRYNEGQFYSE